MVNVQRIRKLLSNAFRYRFLKMTGRPGKIESLSLEVTHRCICRCKMCNIWQISPETADMPLSVWTELLSSGELRGLREIDITGGEPFLHPELRELLLWICKSKPTHFPELRTLAITTNGLLSDRILEITTDILGFLKEQGIDLVFACGLDAVGSLHDQIRKVPGAWKRLSASIDRLNLLRESFPNLVLGIKTTIIPDNVNELDSVLAFAKAHNLFTIISPCIITANRFGNVELQQDLMFSPSDLKKIASFYEEMDKAWSGHRQTMLDFLRTGTVHKPCSAGFNTLFVRHNGDVFPCPIIPKPVGNINHDPLGTLLTRRLAVSFRRKIRTFPECKTCTEPGLERIAWPYEGLTCLRRLIQLGPKEFSRLFNHMGLDKYF